MAIILYRGRLAADHFKNLNDVSSIIEYDGSIEDGYIETVQVKDKDGANAEAYILSAKRLAIGPASVEDDYNIYAQDGTLVGTPNMSIHEVISNLASISPLNGVDGEDGEDGEKGDKGDDGLDAYEVWVEDNPGGTKTEYYAYIKGDKGDTGDKGDKGDIGPSGEGVNDYTLSGVSVNRVYSETAVPAVTGCTNGEWKKLLINSGANATDLTTNVLDDGDLVWDSTELKIINTGTKSIKCAISFDASIFVTNDSGDLDPYVQEGKIGLINENGTELCSSWRSSKASEAGQPQFSLSSAASASTIHTIPANGTLQLQGYLFEGDADRNITLYDYSINVLELSSTVLQHFSETIETAKRVEVQLTPQENIFAGDPLKISSGTPGVTEIFVMRADVGENACYVAKQDYTSGDTEAIGVKVGGVIALDTSGAASDAPVYTAKGKGYTFTKTAEYYQQVGTVARVGVNDGVICVSILELHENDVKEIVTGEAIAAENFCAINGNDGKAYIVTPANSNGLAKNEIYFAVTGGAIGETIQITASKYKVTGATGVANTPYYIGSDGFKTATVPSTSGDIVRKVGTYAQSVFTVNIDKTFFEVS